MNRVQATKDLIELCQRTVHGDNYERLKVADYSFRNLGESCKEKMIEQTINANSGDVTVIKDGKFIEVRAPRDGEAPDTLITVISDEYFAKNRKL